MHDEDSQFLIEVTSQKHVHFASLICQTMEESALQRGTGIAKRSPDILAKYITEGNAVIAIHKSGQWAGFTYLAAWENGSFVSNSGLIVAPAFRDHGIAKKLKHKLFDLSRKKFPRATIVGITTSPAVMKINTELGFKPTAFQSLPQEENFWQGCKSCVNHDILQRTGKKYCLCTAMHYELGRDPFTEKLARAQVGSEEFH